MDDFKNAKVGDRVWSIEFGWGTIDHIKLGKRIHEMSPGSGPNEKLNVVFDIGGPTFDYCIDGNRYVISMQTLFWDEVKIVPPPKPKKKVKKVIEGWLNIYGPGSSECYLHKTKEGADSASKRNPENRLGEAAFICHKYEVEE